jgi:glutamyl-tRNA synthetase
MSKQVRCVLHQVTGPLHIGGVRTALFNYLFAKKTMVFFRLKIQTKTICSRCRRIYHGSIRMVRIAPDETIGKMKNLTLPSKKERFVPTICS